MTQKTQNTNPQKVPYTVSCGSGFRDQVLALATARGVNAADLARSVLLCVPDSVLQTVPDPGDAQTGDRETVTSSSADATDPARTWRRKPRLQMRLPPGLTAPTIRRALSLALSLNGGDTAVEILDGEPVTPQTETKSLEDVAATARAEAHEEASAAAQLAIETAEQAHRDEVARLMATVSTLSFDPLPNGVETRDQARYVLGLPPGPLPNRSALTARFRMLATIHHPDSPTGNHHRMTQVNEAYALLRAQR